MGTVGLLRQAEVDAALLLAHHWDDLYPVDPVAIAVDAGVTARVGSLPGTTSSLIRVHCGAVEMYVDAVGHPRQSRYSVARTLGRVTYLRGRGELTCEGSAFVEEAADAVTLGDRPVQQYSSAFARALLTPSPVMEMLHDRGLSTFEMARFFDVSASLMSVRLAELADAWN